MRRAAAAPARPLLAILAALRSGIDRGAGGVEGALWRRFRLDGSSGTNCLSWCTLWWTPSWSSLARFRSMSLARCTSNGGEDPDSEVGIWSLLQCMAQGVRAAVPTRPELLHLHDVPYKRTQPLSQTVPRPNTAPIPLVCCLELVKSLWASPQLCLPAARCQHSVDRPATSPTSARSLSRRPSLSPTPPPYLPYAVWYRSTAFGPAHSCASQLPPARTACAAWSVPYKRTQPLSQTIPRPTTAPIPPVCCIELVNSLWASPQMCLPAARCPHRVDRPATSPTSARSLSRRPSLCPTPPPYL